MPNAIKWITNVGKSISYSMIDEIKGLNPTLNSFKEDSGDLFKSIHSTLKMSSIKNASKSISDTEYFRLGRDAIQNLKDDIKTGKLYNKEREEETSKKVIEKFTGFSDSDFGFDLDDTFNFDDTEEAVVSSSEKTNRMVDLVGQKTSIAISSAMVQSSEFIVQSNRKSTKALFDQNNALFGRLHADMGTINQNINSMMQFSREATTTHYNNSSTFYTNMNNAIQETNSLLKELVDIQKSVYKPEKTYGGSSSGGRFSDIISSDGTPNIGALIDLAKKNISNHYLVSMLKMGNDVGMGESLAGSLAKFIPDAIAKSLIPNVLKTSMEELNKTLSGVMGNLMMNLMSSGGGFIKNILRELFMPDTSLKDTLDTSKYKKDAIPFDGITKKAIVEVIPTYLSKILSAISSQKETRYDYDKGKFVSMDDIRKEFKEIQKSNSYSSTSDIRQAMLNSAAKVKFDKDEKGQGVTKDQFVKDLDAFLHTQYQNARVFNEYKDTIDPSTYGMKGGKKSEVSAKLIQQLWKTLPKSEKALIASSILRQRDYQNSNMKSRESEQSDILFNLFNDSDKAFGTTGVKDKTSDAYKSSIRYNSTIVSILSDIRKEVSYIRTYGISKKSKKNKSSKTSSFDSFDPYKTEELLEEDSSYYAYIPENSIEDDIEGKNKDDKKDSIFSKLSKSKSFGETIKILKGNIGEIIHAPVNFLSTVIRKADETVYDLIFGRKNEPGHTGILKTMITGVKDQFQKFGDWLDENLLSPLKEKLTKENIKNASRRLFSIFGIDIDKTIKDVREFFFGSKDDKGTRTKKGIFNDFTDGFKSAFKDVGSWIKNAAGSVADTLGIRGKLTKEGREKKARYDSAKKEYKEKTNIFNTQNNTKNEEAVDGQAFAGLKRVPKTGIYALSEGEAVIPPDRNPNNIARRYRNEKNAIDKFRQDGKIIRLAEGTDKTVTEEDLDKLKQEKKQNKVNRDDYVKGEEAIQYKVADEIKNIFGPLSEYVRGLFKGVTDKAGEKIKEATQKKDLNNLMGDMFGEAKKYLPEMAVGGVIGSGVSLITGMIGGPLLGAAIGAGTGLIIKSRVVQDALFGEWDEENQTYKNGIIKKEIANNIRKYVPSIGKGATLGAITSILPFVPGGPVAGIILGGAAGFVSKNETVYNALFGKENILKDFPQKVKSALPKMGAGAVLGLVGGPFGVATNIMLGSAVGFATTTNKFKDIFFGKEGENGVRSGGVLGVIKETIEVPLKNFVKSNLDWAKDRFDKVVVRNLMDFIKPVKNRIDILFSRIGDAFSNVAHSMKTKIHDKIITPIEERLKDAFAAFGKIFSPIFKAVRGVVGGTLGLPFKALGGIGRRMQRSDIKKGRASYLDAQGRMNARADLGLGTGDAFYQTDNVMAGMDQETLQSNLSAVQYLRKGKKQAWKDQEAAAASMSIALNRNKAISKKAQKEIKKMLDKGRYEEAEAYINRLNISDGEKEKLIKEFRSAGSKMRRAKEYELRFKGKSKTDKEQYRAQLEQVMKDSGLDINKFKSLRDAEKYLEQELKTRGFGQPTEESPADIQEKATNIIANKIDEAVNQLKLLNKLINPEVEFEYVLPKNINKKVAKAEAKAEKRNEKDAQKKETEEMKSQGLPFKERLLLKYHNTRSRLSNKASSIKDSILGIVDPEKREEKRKSDTQFYNGSPMKTYTDKNGDVHIDKSDSETVQTLKEKEEDRRNSRSILSTITNIPGQIIGFFGGKKDDGNKNNGLFSKILKVTGIAMIGAAMAPTLYRFAKNTLAPILSNIFDNLKNAVIDLKDGLITGFIGDPETGEGGLAEKIGIKIGEGARFITDWLSGSGQFKNEGFPGFIKSILPDIGRTIESMLAVAIPKLAELIVTNLPGLLGGVLSGVGNLFTGLKNALTGADDNKEDDTITGVVKPIGTVSTGDIGYKPSNIWNLKGIPSFNPNIEVGAKDINGDKVKSVTTTMSDTKTDKEIDTTKMPKAYSNTASNRLSKVRSEVDGLLGNLVTINTDGKEKTMSVYDMLNSDEIVAYSQYESHGIKTYVPVKGSELLNIPDAARTILGIDTRLSQGEKEQAAQDAGLDHGNNIFDPNSKDPKHMIAQTALNQAMTGSRKATDFLSKRATKNLNKTSIFAKARGAVYKAGSYTLEGTQALADTFLPESLIGAERKKNSILNSSVAGKIKKAGEKLNKEYVSKGLKKFAEKIKKDIKNLFTSDGVKNIIKKILNMGKKNADDIIEEAGEKLAKELSVAVVEQGSKQTVGFVTSTIANLTLPLKIAQAIASFALGCSTAADICGILYEDVTPGLKIICGAFNAINECIIISGLIPADLVFQSVIACLKWITGDDILGLEELQAKANATVSEESKKAGKQITLEDHNNMAATKEATGFVNASIKGETAKDRTVRKYIENGYKGSKTYVLGDGTPMTITDKDIEEYQGNVEGSYAAGTPYVSKSGLYALSAGEYIGRASSIGDADNNNPLSMIFNSILNKTGNVIKDGKKSITNMAKRMRETYSYISKGSINNYWSVKDDKNAEFGDLNRVMDMVHKTLLYPLALSKSVYKDAYTNIKKNTTYQTSGVNTYYNPNSIVNDAWEAGKIPGPDGTMYSETNTDESNSILSDIPGGASGLYDKNGQPLDSGNTGLSKAYNYNKLPNIRQIDTSKRSGEKTSLSDNFVSQTSGTISKFSFKGNNDTMEQKVSDVGCAPASATMIINTLKGKNTIALRDAVKDAVPYKVSNSGVSSSYFDDEFYKYGIETNYIKDPKLISSNVKRKVPTILLGQDANNTSKNKSPFGPNPHYVVADSMSKDGKYIYINDPESKQPRKKYSIKDILSKTLVAISTKLNSAVTRKLSNRKLYVGGAKKQVKASAGDYIGKYVKQFESGDKGPLAIDHCGNDGGLSFGSYQMIYSGSARTFWSQYFAPKYGEPTSAQDLKTKWEKAVSDLGVQEFYAKEWEYIFNNYYKLALDGIKPFDPNNYSRAIQDCIWSWAVHRGHNGCIKEWKQVLAKIPDPMSADEIELINACYDVRASNMTGDWSSIASGRYGYGPASERAIMLSLVGQPPIDYTTPDGVLFSGATAGTDGLQPSGTTNTGSIIDQLFAPFDNLFVRWGLTSGNTSSVSGESGTGESEYYSDAGISGPVSANKAIAEKQVAVVAKMKSILGKNLYGQNNAKYPATRDPDKGGGDCSSTVQWAYKKVTGIDVGSWTGAQMDSNVSYIVDDGRDQWRKPDESKLQLGDMVLYGDKAGSHVELYYGDGRVITHGGPDKGPKIADLNRRNDYWATKRLNDFRGDNGTTTFTGSGSGLVGSGSFVSQLDPRYANNRFNRPYDTQKQTFADTGCAPASATMVLNDIFGRASDLKDATNTALKYKKQNDGVSADYFGDIYAKNGLKANYYGNSDQVMSDLGRGKDVVLLGSDKNNTSKSNSPFGPNPHYVVASGVSKNGKNITIKDPEAKGPKDYPINKILGNTSIGIGYGSGLALNRLKSYIGRATGSFSGILYVGDNRMEHLSHSVKEDDVSFITKSAAGITWLKYNAAPQIEKAIEKDPKIAVVIALGLYDLYNVNQYIEFLNKFKSKGNIFVMSVNPVDKNDRTLQSQINQFNAKMKPAMGSKYLDISPIISSGKYTCVGKLYDEETNKKIHSSVKSLLMGKAGVNATNNAEAGITTTSGDTSLYGVPEDPKQQEQKAAPSFLDDILGVGDKLATLFGLSGENVAASDQSGTTGGTYTGGPGSDYPKYTLSNSHINDIATCITGETGGTDSFANRQEASQMANLNEVTYGRGPDGDSMNKTLHGGWYAPASWTRGVTDDAKQAVKDVLIDGKRILPRYVTEHDMFPLDAAKSGEWGGSDRSTYKRHETIIKQNPSRFDGGGASYVFYDFFGKDKTGDVAGYYKQDYEKYKNDVPWGAGSGLLKKSINNNFDNMRRKSTGRATGIATSTLGRYTTESNTTRHTETTNINTSTRTDNVNGLIKTVIKLLVEIVTNTSNLTGVVEILSKLVELQGSITEENKASKVREIKDLRSKLSSTLKSHNVSNSGATKLSSLMESVETLAAE